MRVVAVGRTTEAGFLFWLKLAHRGELCAIGVKLSLWAEDPPFAPPM
jgi:hypothetical protein